jgi:hypothetical protein
VRNTAAIGSCRSPGARRASVAKYFPVSIDATENEVCGACAYARSKRIPDAASASMLGVVLRG